MCVCVFVCVCVCVFVCVCVCVCVYNFKCLVDKATTSSPLRVAFAVSPVAAYIYAYTGLFWLYSRSLLLLSRSLLAL